MIDTMIVEDGRAGFIHEVPCRLFVNECGLHPAGGPCSIGLQAYFSVLIRT